MRWRQFFLLAKGESVSTVRCPRRVGNPSGNVSSCIGNLNSRVKMRLNQKWVIGGRLGSIIEGQVSNKEVSPP